MASNVEHTEATLRIIYQPEVGDHRIDIVLVDGLGTRYSSVKLDPDDAAKQYHIHDLLPNHVNSARIFTYCPPSGGHGDLDPLFSVDSLERGAECLLRVLYEQKTHDKMIEESKGRTDAETEDFQASRTPLAFIAHDLGGAVVKKALVIAANSTMYRKLSMAATHLVFFGTPHNAPDLTSWEETLLTIFLSFARHSASPIPKDPARRARSLAFLTFSLPLQTTQN